MIKDDNEDPVTRVKSLKGEAKRTKPASRVRPQKRAEQTRSVSTRTAILNAAIMEFAELGFEAASIRNIAKRIDIKHPAITYHYPTKDDLWRAAAEQAFSTIRAEWDKEEPELAVSSPLNQLRLEYRSLFQYTVTYPEFHRFMRQESLQDNSRLKWVAKTVLTPLLDRLLPQISAAQRDGSIPQVEPIVFHYMMVSLTSMLSEFGREMHVTSGLSAQHPCVVADYWSLVEAVVFGARRAHASEQPITRIVKTRKKTRSA